MTTDIAFSLAILSLLGTRAAFGLIIFLTAFANSGWNLSDAAFHPISLGVFIGLFVGKAVGISVFVWLSVKFFKRIRIEKKNEDRDGATQLINREET